MADRERWDAIIAGAGHNGLVAAILLARAGRRVLILERAPHAGGAAVSASPFPGVDVRLSRYSYLVSLFPAALLAQLGVRVELRRRRVSSYTPHGDAGVLVCDDARRTRDSFVRTLGDDRGLDQMHALYAMTERLAGPVFASLTEPLRDRGTFAEELVNDPEAWSALFERPLDELLQRTITDDLVRGVVATDALIGTFASLDDPQLRQNRCFLYHLIGNGHGRWDVPVGGMGALSGALIEAAQAAGAQLRTGAEVVGAHAGDDVTVQCSDGSEVRGRHLLCGAAPSVLARWLGDPPPDPAPEGSQLKLNLLLRRLPRLRDEAVSPREAFAGTLHVNEGYAQLQTAYEQAERGEIPSLPPCEAYCHSLTDPSILSDELRAAGAQTLTVFGLHMPARLFAGDPAAAAAAKQRAVAATLRSLDTVLAEPIAGCLWSGAGDEPCLEARTPYELEDELGLPAGHIFHRDLSWPFAEDPADAGRWGVETVRPNVWLCGAGARRGGGVSGIAGHNAARAVLAADAA